MIPAYGCIPYMISMVMVTVLSHVLTSNEAFLLDIALNIGIVWSLIIIVVGFMTVHDYTLKETIISLIITCVFIIIAAIISLVIIIMWNQLWQFLKTIGKEMAQNVLR
jgi:Flp pilus assembly pilin Flp